MHVIQDRRFGDIESYTFGFGPMGPPLMSVSIYLINGVLIDTAQSHMRKHVINILSQKRVRRILLTHHHEDHSGNAAEIQRAFGAEVLGNSQTRQKMARAYRILPYQHLIWGRTEPVAVSPLPDVVETRRHRFRPIHTPGHSRDHTVYLEEKNGWLFSGDLYLGDRIKYFRSDERFGDQIASIRRVLTFEFDALFCAHRPRPENGKMRLRQKLAFLLDIHGKIGSLLEKGISETEIVRRMDDRQDRFTKYLTMGNASKANMIRSSIRAHTQKLE